MGDSLIQHFIDEREAKVNVITTYAETAKAENRDLSQSELETISVAKARIEALDRQIDTLAGDLSMAEDTQQRVKQLAAGQLSLSSVEYRDAGVWLFDQAHAILGGQSPIAVEARERLSRYQALSERVASHQVTSGGVNPGALPEPILADVVNLVDGSRPFVTFLGTRPVPAGPTFHRPRIVDAGLDTRVTVQAADKTELGSEEFTVARDPVTVASKATYLNLSRQWLDWAVPDGMAMVLTQLGISYARKTEQNAVDAAEASTGGVVYPMATNTDPAIFQAAVADAKLAYYTAMAERASWILMGPDGEAHLDSMVDTSKRPSFPYLNPVNSNAAMGSSGFLGLLMGLQPIVSYAVSPNVMVVGGPSSVELFEQRWETMSVVEPSVAGVQVAVGGYFAEYLPNPAAPILLEAA